MARIKTNKYRRKLGWSFCFHWGDYGGWYILWQSDVKRLSMGKFVITFIKIDIDRVLLAQISKIQMN